MQPPRMKAMTAKPQPVLLYMALSAFFQALKGRQLAFRPPPRGGGGEGTAGAPRGPCGPDYAAGGARAGWSSPALCFRLRSPHSMRAGPVGGGFDRVSAGGAARRLASGAGP